MIIPIEPWLELADQNSSSKSFARVGESFSGLMLSADPAADEFRMEVGNPGKEVMGHEVENRIEFYHQPIMGEEILGAMQPIAGKQVLDCTVGGGGHSEIFLKHGAHVIGCDQDGDALAHASKRLASYGDQFLPVRGNFEDLDGILSEVGVESVDGMLLDLGISSKQIDNPERGFSFREDGPLDMRMDQRSDFSAEELVNEWSVEDLTRIFRDYGEEKRAFRAAREIEAARKEDRIETTLQLSEIVARAIPKVSAKNPATRVFQAIRIAVNRELEVLETALEKSVEHLAPGGVLAILTFHSLEDRIVKQFMRRCSTEFLDRPEWPEPRPNPDFSLHLPTRKAIMPSEKEMADNSRSRSAKLRVAVKNEE